MLRLLKKKGSLWLGGFVGWHHRIGKKNKERAKERAKVRNLCAETGNLIPSYLDVANPSLAQTALMVGIDLGVSIWNLLRKY
jgi:hypothetical protein